MTKTEEQNARVTEDPDFFRVGLPAMLSALVKQTWAEPFMLMRRLLGERADALLEGGARAAGRFAGAVSRPLFAAQRQAGEHQLEDTLKATRIAENLSGIYGKDYYINDKKIVRRVHTCPFRHREGAGVLCHIGEAAGQELFGELVPGIRHKVHVTMARGHGFCEYSYEVG